MRYENGLNTFAPHVQFFIGAAIQAGTKMLGATMAMIGSAVNGAKIKKEIGKVEARADEAKGRLAETQAEYRELENTVESAQDANAKRQMQMQADKASKQMLQNSVRGGMGSAEAAIAAAGAMQEANANSAANLAAESAARRDALRGEREAAVAAGQQQVDALLDKAQQMKMDQINQSQQAFSSLAG